MQIISDFHDYYDIGMKNGCDPQLPYRRFRCEEPVQLELSSGNYWWNWRKKHYDRYNIWFFGFAGKVYPAVKYVFESQKSDYCFDYECIDQRYYDGIMENHPYWEGVSSLREKEYKFHFSRLKKEIRELFDLKDHKELLELFEQFRTAIFVYKYREDQVVINERLNVYGFQKVLPPMQAFQELEMYVGANLTKPTIEEPPISDKIKAEIHGFDKYSFRKDKKQ